MAPSTRGRPRKPPLTHAERSALLTALSAEGRTDMARYESQVEERYRELRARKAKGGPNAPIGTVPGFEKWRRRTLDNRLLWLANGGTEQNLDPPDPDSPWCSPPWNVSVLPDGTSIPDRLKRRTLRAVMFPSSGVWLHSSEAGRYFGHMDDAIPLFVMSLVFWPIVVAVLIAPTALRGNGFVVLAAWPTLPALIYWVYHRRSKRRAKASPPSDEGAAVITLDYDPSQRGSGEALARWAADDLGAQVVDAMRPEYWRAAAGRVAGWNLDHGTTIGNGIFAFFAGEILVVSTKGLENADFHRRLKGQILHLQDLERRAYGVPSSLKASVAGDLAEHEPSRQSGLVWRETPIEGDPQKAVRRWFLELGGSRGGIKGVLQLVKATIRNMMPRLGPAPLGKGESMALETIDAEVRLTATRTEGMDLIVLEMRASASDNRAHLARKAIVRALGQA